MTTFDSVILILAMTNLIGAGYLYSLHGNLQRYLPVYALIWGGIVVYRFVL